MRVEPISKSPEEDDEASELDEAEEVLGVILPAHKYAALPLDPGEEARPMGICSSGKCFRMRSHCSSVSRIIPHL